MSLRLAAPMIAMAVLAACGDGRKPSGSVAATATVGVSGSAVAASARPSGTSTSAPSAASTSAPSAASGTPSPPGTGAGDCKLARGPVRLATTGAAAFGPQSGGLLTLGTNRDGAPAWEAPRFPDPPRVTAGGSLPPRPTARPSDLLPGPGPAPSSTAEAAGDPAPDRTRLPACAVAGGFSFCADGEGAIHRRPLGGGDDKVVARGRKGTPVAAAALGNRTFYAFLANQKTTEGVIVRAFAAVDDEAPIALSEEGSGATYIGLVARDSDVLAMYVDARTALTPVHARTLRADDRLVRGADAVVFVGGGAESHVRGAVGRGAKGPALLFIPGSHDDKKFGHVVIPVDGDPRDDMPGKWSFYPAQILSPGLAVTRGASPIRLVRSRPDSDEPGVPDVLELGHVAADGAFVDRCVLAKGASFSDLAVAVDDTGGLWVAYTNREGTWVEQRGGESGSDQPPQGGPAGSRDQRPRGGSAPK